MDHVSPYFKAIVGALVAGLGVLAAGLDNNELNGQEWLNAAIAFLVALGAVWAVPNLDPKARHQQDSVQPPGGHGLDPDRP